jgi:hypothetical protein
MNHIKSYIFRECEKYFGKFETKISADDSVLCDTTHSKVVPLEGGEVQEDILDAHMSHM